MEKLRLKHLAPYLPYKLNILSKRHFCKYGEQTILKVNGIAFQDTADKPYWQYEFVYDNDLKFSDINEKGFKPILRPLSDLTKEIEVNGEKFVPIDKINEYDETAMSYSLSFYIDCTLRLPYYVIKYLFEWHFDVFGLIEKELAIDFNTLNNEKNTIL